MKLGRGVLLGVLVVAVVLLLMAGLVFTPGFQTWAVRRALAGQPGLKVTLDRVSAGLNRVRLGNVRVARNGAVLTLPAADIELPVITAAFGQKLKIHRLEARGWVLDLTHARLTTDTVTVGRPSPSREFSLLPSAYGDVVAAAPSLVFTGLFQQLKLPFDLSLDGVALDGQILLPTLPGRAAARADVTLTGGGLAAGQAGKFDYTATIRFEGEGAAIHEVRVTGTLGVVMDSPRTFTRFVAATTAEAEGPQFPGGVRLALDATAARSIAGENYALAILSGPKQLAAIDITYAAGESHLRGNWRLDTHDADLAPFLLGREFPAFDAAGEGRFDLDTSFAELNASGRLNATADRLEVIRPELSGLGSIHVTTEFDFAQHGTTTRVDRLAISVEGARPVVTVNALQPFEFNLKRGDAGMPVVTELNIADPAKELVGVVFQGLPLAWVRPWLAATGLALNGDELRGEIAASARDGGFSVRSKTPLTLGNVSVALKDGGTVFRSVDLTLAASADYTPQGWQVAMAPLSVASNGHAVLALEVKAGQLAGRDQPIKIAGDWTVQLPALLAQMGGANAGLLTGGKSQGEFAASLGSKREVQIRLGLTELVAPDAGALPQVSADLRGDLDSDGKLTFNLPIVVDRVGRKSDLTFAGTLTPGGSGRVTAARLTSEQLIVDDLKAFILPLVDSFDSPLAAPGAPLHPSVAFWNGIVGEVTLALKKVAYSDQLQVTDFTGTLRLDPAALKLADARAGFGPDSAIRLEGGLTLGAGPRPAYRLAVDLTVENFDLGAIFRALDPTKPPTVEGRISLMSHLSGTGATLEALAAQTQGDLKVTGKSGVFRALSADMSDRIQKTQSRVAAIGSLLGVVTDDYVNKTKILADIAKSLAEIPYDQLSMTAVRDASLNFVVKDFTLISPEVRLGGSGTIRYVANTPIVAQPLELQLNLGARGRLGDLMKRAGLLEAQQDGLGYAAFSVPLKLGGTLAKPDSGAIRDALLNSALERSGLLDGLFGRGK